MKNSQDLIDIAKHMVIKFDLSDFYEITKRTLIATNNFTNGKVVSVLEGGYDLNALAESANEHVKALLENNK